MKRLWLISILGCLASGAVASEFSITVAPGAHLDYRGEGKIFPQGYVNRFDGNTAPLYRLEWLQDVQKGGYWGLGLWHTGVFGGGTYGHETVPDSHTGQNYQSDQMNVGFTNMFVTYHRPLEISFTSSNPPADVPVTTNSFRLKISRTTERCTWNSTGKLSSGRWYVTNIFVNPTFI